MEAHRRTVFERDRQAHSAAVDPVPGDAELAVDARQFANRLLRAHYHSQIVKLLKRRIM